MSELSLVERDGAVVIAVRAQPKAARSAVVEVVAGTGAVKVRVAAPPVDGAANEALLRFLAKEVLHVAPSSLTLVGGSTGRDKRVAVHGLSVDEVRERLLSAIG